MSTPSERLAALGLTLPPVAPPQAAYVPAIRTGNYVYISGQLPLADGKLQGTGKVGDTVSAEEAAALARPRALNGLAAAASVAGGLDAIRRIVKVTGFVASAPSSPGSRRWSTARASSSSRSSARPGGTRAAPSGWRCCRSTPRSRSS